MRRCPTLASGTPPKEASLAVADLNGDGNLDIVGTGSGLGVLVWLGNGNGTFQQAVQYTDVGGGSLALVLGDFNGDGKPDVGLWRMEAGSQNRVSKCATDRPESLIGWGDGTFGPPTSYQTVFAPESLAVGDFNGDGKPDLVVIGHDQSAVWCTPNGAEVSILLGNGDGSFQTHKDFWIAAMYPDYDPRVSLAVGDFNLDGLLDVVVGSGYEAGHCRSTVRRRFRNS